MKSLLTIILIILTITITAQAKEVRITWNPNTEPDLKGYSVHVGTVTGEYPIKHDITCGPNDASCCKLTLDMADGTYFFTATAVDHDGNRSDYAKEVEHTVDSTPPGAVINVEVSSKAETESYRIDIKKIK